MSVSSTSGSGSVKPEVQGTSAGLPAVAGPATTASKTASAGGTAVAALTTAVHTVSLVGDKKEEEVAALRLSKNILNFIGLKIRVLQHRASQQEQKQLSELETVLTSQKTELAKLQEIQGIESSFFALEDEEHAIVLKTLKLFCPNLIKLSLSYCSASTVALLPVLFPALSSLHLIYQGNDSGVPEKELCQAIKQLKRLQSFEWDISGKESVIAALPASLERLALTDTIPMELKTMQAMSHLHALRVLQLPPRHQLTKEMIVCLPKAVKELDVNVSKECISDLATACPHLETLVLQKCDAGANFTVLPATLRTMVFKYGKITDADVQQLRERELQKIEIVKCRDITGAFCFTLPTSLKELVVKLSESPDKRSSLSIVLEQMKKAGLKLNIQFEIVY